MNFREQYPKQVTLGEDGIYRWSADVDLSRDHFTQNYLLKVLGIVCGGLFAVMMIAMASVGDFTFWWIMALICGATLAFTMTGYRIYRNCIEDCYTVGFEMNEEKVTVVRKPSSQRRMENASIVMSLLSPTNGAAMRNSSAPQSVWFSGVKKIFKHPETCRICLKQMISTMPVWVPEGDYETVLRFMEEHTGAPTLDH